ncbi:MAG: hypothetical protein U5K00_12555 [Melioribacteraceae bacterium]|nr:hypothetical protein [Melioribacteraceae bacterium]
MKQTMGENTPQYKTAKIQLESLVKEVDKIKYSNEENLENPFGSVFLPLDQFPEVSKKYTDIYTNLLLQQKLQEFLLPEYENAKMQLLKDKPVIQVIDYASAPDYKSRPKRAFIVLGALLVALLLQFIYILIVERNTVVARDGSR